ncbi:MAG: hypothetical protein JRJ12_06280 [Deltaproteobacteria bacterium]|nr:hypothetical protein [Deltaproteobacteria bacterium]MBW2069641.1 hypothetical protein [Deltaproteobacteria bacterium]
MSKTTYESVVCPGCACLCDDIDMVVEDNRVTSISNICTWGMSKFFVGKKFHHRKTRYRLQRPVVRGTAGSRETSYRAAARQAAEILARSQRILLYGFSHCSYAAQEIGVQLAARLHGILAPGDGGLLYHFGKALLKYHPLLVTFEEIRDQADLAIFWGGNPMHSCPRLVSRYCIFARGRFTERGYEDRQTFTVDFRATEMDSMSNMVVLPESGGDLETLEALRLLLQQEKPRSYKGRLSALSKLVQAAEQASYGVIFCGRGILYSGQAELVFDRLCQIAAALHGQPSLAIIPMATDFNANGLYQAILRQNGFGTRPTIITTDLLSWDLAGIDAVLAVGGDLWWFLTEEQRHIIREHDIPIITIAAFADHTTVRSQISFPCGIVGVEKEGVAYRMDSLPLSLGKVIDSNLPDDHEILADIGAFL